MKSFVIAVVVLSLIFALALLNTFYVSNKVDEMLLICDGLTNNSSADGADALVTRWQSCKTIISLSVHKTVLERAENAILALERYADSPKDLEYQLKILKIALNEIADSQKLTVDSIF